MIRHIAAGVLTLVLAGVAVEAQPAGPATPAPAVPTVEFPTDSLGRLVFRRETYSYPRDGRRDPFASLIATGDIRPIFEDLQVTGIIVDPTGRASRAILKDVSTNEIYKARVGSVFGRIRVTAIRDGEVAVSIDEFGFPRQEVLTQTKPSPATRTP
ncbi:MAG: hypothetical protein KJZ74_00765 [Gemmatimonadales bacterium]|nr:hypothetical protein [Gemmatimonadales bacterium]